MGLGSFVFVCLFLTLSHGTPVVEKHCFRARSCESPAECRGGLRFLDAPMKDEKRSDCRTVVGRRIKKKKQKRTQTRILQGSSGVATRREAQCNTRPVKRRPEGRWEPLHLPDRTFPFFLPFLWRRLSTLPTFQRACRHPT